MGSTHWAPREYKSMLPQRGSTLQPSACDATTLPMRSLKVYKDRLDIQILVPVLYLCLCTVSVYFYSIYPYTSACIFLANLKTIRPQGMLALLDVDSLFTNIPVDATRDTICRPHAFPALPSPTNFLAKLLFAWTTQCQLTTQRSFFRHVDGVSTDSSLGVTLVNYIAQVPPLSGHMWPDTVHFYTNISASEISLEQYPSG